MKNPCSWNVEVKRYFVETKEVNKKGNPIMRPITHRKMFVIDPCPITDSGLYRVVVVRRHGETTYSISALPRIAQPWWTHPQGLNKTWYKIGEEYKRIERLDETQFLHWLKVRMGEGMAKIALETLMTAEPTDTDEALSEAA